MAYDTIVMSRTVSAIIFIAWNTWIIYTRKENEGRDILSQSIYIVILRINACCDTAFLELLFTSHSADNHSDGREKMANTKALRLKKEPYKERGMSSHNMYALTGGNVHIVRGERRKGSDVRLLRFVNQW